MSEEVYQTDDDYSVLQINEICQWFDKEIGTEYEISDSGYIDGAKYAIIVDLTMNEVKKIREFEISYRKKHHTKESLK